MDRNYDLLLQVLRKWPLDKTKGSRCFGFRIRELAKNGFPTGNIFEGTEAQNHSKLKALLRLAENKHANEFPNKLKRGASGFTVEEIKSRLSDNYVSKFLSRIDDNVASEDSKK